MLLSLIPKGRQNAIKRTELVRLYGKPDRVVRQEIEDLRHQGFLIANHQDGKGYFICDTPQEAYAYFKAQESRAKAILHSCNYFKMYVARSGILSKDVENQMRMEM